MNEHNDLALAEQRWQELVDVIIVARGGGSAEDLWAFNEEELARTIRASQIPVLSGVGHETDTTIADFAADVRAPTPSAAAEMVAAREDEMEARVFDLTRDLVRAERFQILNLRGRVQEAAMSTAFDEVRERLRAAKAGTERATRALEISITRSLERARRRSEVITRRLSPASLSARVSAARTRFAVLSAARDAAIQSKIENERARLAVAAASLDALSPLAVLKRGYALAEDGGGRLLQDARQVSAGDTVRLRLAAGTLRCRVEETETP